MHLDGELPRSQFHFLWPNLGVNIFPGRPNISIGPMVPLTPDRTYRFLDYFFGPDVDQAWIDELMAFDDQVGVEDRDLVEGVHSGIASGALDHGVLMTHSEQLIGHFQQLTASRAQPTSSLHGLVAGAPACWAARMGHEPSTGARRSGGPTGNLRFRTEAWPERELPIGPRPRAGTRVDLRLPPVPKTQEGFS